LVLARTFQDPQDGLYYMESPHLEITSAGGTPEEARTVFDEAVQLTLADWATDGVLERRLADRGFSLIKDTVGDCDFVFHLPPGVEVELAHQPPPALPPHYEIQPARYSVDVGVARSL
jgi:predicted RNase H-like HicB family nuclease